MRRAARTACAPHSLLLRRLSNKSAGSEGPYPHLPPRSEWSASASFARATPPPLPSPALEKLARSAHLELPPPGPDRDALAARLGSLLGALGDVGEAAAALPPVPRVVPGRVHPLRVEGEAPLADPTSHAVKSYGGFFVAPGFGVSKG